MTLKKLLKKISDEECIEIYEPNPLGAELHFGFKKEVDPHYMDMVVKDVFVSGNRLCINVKKPNPKRSTDNKAYKKWMKKYVKDHMDEIVLKDGGYAGDSADDDGCCDCKYTNLDSGSFPCKECSHAYIDKWESKE